MKRKLGEIATIQTGLFAKPVPNGDLTYLQSKYFDARGQCLEDLYLDLAADERTVKYVLQPGDVLFAAKGTKNFAACYDDIKMPAVASTSFFVIRLKVGFVLPAYLKWYMNRPDTQALLKGYAKGTSIVSISKSALLQMDVSIPEIEKQKKILKIDELHNREKELKKEIEFLLERKMQQMLINVIK